MESKLEKEKKSPKAERIEALLTGKPVDRVAVSPLDTTCGSPGFCAVHRGVPVQAVYNDPEKSFEVQVSTLEHYGFDSIPIFGSGVYGCWEFGGDIKFPETEYDQAPSAVRHPVKTEEDVEKLALPDLATSGVLPMAVRFSKLQAAAGMRITPFMASPFTCAGNIVGLDTFCRWVIKKPDLVRRVLRISTDHLLDVVRHWADTFGPERLLVHDIIPSEANQVLSKRHFEKVAYPFLMEFHEKVLEIGVKHIRTHICGGQNANLPLLAEVPMGDPGIVSFGREVDIAKAVEYFGDRSIIAGNIDPTEIMMGTPEKIYDLSKDCIEKGKAAPGGFILSAGCEVPLYAPAENLEMMVRAAEDFGQYE